MGGVNLPFFNQTAPAGTGLEGLNEGGVTMVNRHLPGTTDGLKIN